MAFAYDFVKSAKLLVMCKLIYSPLKSGRLWISGQKNAAHLSTATTATAAAMLVGLKLAGRAD
jgi:hypothetical protein